MIRVYDAVSNGVVFVPFVSHTTFPVSLTVILLARVQVPWFWLQEAMTLIADGVTWSDV